VSGRTLAIGSGVGLAGLGIGLYYRDQTADIAKKAEQAKKDIKTLNEMQDEYETEWHQLQALLDTYKNGGSIDMNQVDAYKTELAALEQQIDAQAQVVQGDIGG